MRGAVAGVLLLGACARLELAEGFDFDPAGLTRGAVSMERGTLTWVGEERDDVRVDAVSWGAGASRKAAARREAGNLYAVEAIEETLSLSATSARTGAGVDFDVASPFDLSVDATVARGGVWLERLDGRHVVEAERIDAVALAGDVTAVATLLGVDLDLRPAETCFISVDTTGGATLRLPRFGAYDLVVETDPEAPTDVADIGFDEVRMAPGRVTAWRSPGTCVIRVVVRTGGAFTLVAAEP
jgi:hypothetical protein